LLIFLRQQLDVGPLIKTRKIDHALIQTDRVGSCLEVEGYGSLGDYKSRSPPLEHRRSMVAGKVDPD
jgi:hypothetical protein